MNDYEILKTYAMLYVQENDEFDVNAKLNMLFKIKEADEGMLMELFINGDIEHPLMLEEVNDFDALLFEAEYLSEILPGLPGVSLKDITGSLEKLKRLKTLLKGKIQAADDAMKKAIQNKINAANDKIDMLQHKISGSPKPKKGFEKAVEGGKEIMQQAKDKAGEVGEKVVGAAGKVAKYASENPGTAATAAVAAAAALTAGVMAYRRFISKAGRRCKDAPDKKACRREFKQKAISAQIAAISAGKAKCFKTKNPGVCQSKIDVKLSKLQAKKSGGGEE